VSKGLNDSRKLGCHVGLDGYEGRLQKSIQKKSR